MRIGILADIHDDADQLCKALEELKHQTVDQTVVLGDSFARTDMRGFVDVAVLLHEVGAIGVWGNHDCGLAGDVDDEIRDWCDPRVLEFTGKLQPHVSSGDCHFSHVEPWLDPHDVTQLWYFDGPPDTPEKASRSFSAVPHRFLFVGHFHQWLLMTPAGKVAWDGSHRVTLASWERCLVVVAPVCDGHCAVFDTESSELTPRSW